MYTKSTFLLRPLGGSNFFFLISSYLKVQKQWFLTWGNLTSWSKFICFKGDKFYKLQVICFDVYKGHKWVGSR